MSQASETTPLGSPGSPARAPRRAARPGKPSGAGAGRAPAPPAPAARPRSLPATNRLPLAPCAGAAAIFSLEPCQRPLPHWPRSGVCIQWPSTAVILLACVVKPSHPRHALHIVAPLLILLNKRLKICTVPMHEGHGARSQRQVIAIGRPSQLVRHLGSQIPCSA